MSQAEKYGSLTLERNRLAAIPVGVVDPKSRIILLMGTTGSGKSKFIESLCPEQKHLVISGNTLTSVTQEVEAYTLWNASWSVSRTPVILVDTPGFSDPNLSESRIVFALQEWLSKNETRYYHRILFFERITDNRMSGNKRRLLKVFKTLVGPDAASCVTIVTSMWNQLWTSQQLDAAEQRYEQLENEHWKDLLQKGAQMVRYDCTKTSAAEIIGKGLSSHVTAYPPKKPDFFEHEAWTTDDDGVSPMYMHMLHQTLCERIEVLKGRLRSIQGELAVMERSEGEDEVGVVCGELTRKEMEEVKALLEAFEDDRDTIVGVAPSLGRYANEEKLQGHGAMLAEELKGVSMSTSVGHGTIVQGRGEKLGWLKRTMKRLK
ncbi:hypothetical protein CVT24_012566 [Panaeolus cyanescens]|uniref:G domain-containing protein n=1 Tax=Panaeolus cyanescens TaxID=181874 RepID=A0A409WKS7_9AGAR|nr:hypothetical protein CVT24_012566 [Panaeolus cyanescens]